MTDRTLQAIEVARRIARGEIVVELTRQDLADAIVELAGGRPNVIDQQRVKLGDFARAAGDAVCSGALPAPHSNRHVTCNRSYYDHPTVQGFEWLHRLCDGRLVKL